MAPAPFADLVATSRAVAGTRARSDTIETVRALRQAALVADDEGDG